MQENNNNDSLNDEVKSFLSDSVVKPIKEFNSDLLNKKFSSINIHLEKIPPKGEIENSIASLEDSLKKLKKLYISNKEEITDTLESLEEDIKILANKDEITSELKQISEELQKGYRFTELLDTIQVTNNYALSLYIKTENLEKRIIKIEPQITALLSYYEAKKKNIEVINSDLKSTIQKSGKSISLARVSILVGVLNLIGVIFLILVMLGISF